MRFGLLGTGYWAAETQGAALAAHPEVDFVGVWGRSAGRAATVADRYGVRAFAEVDELLSEVDAVAVALPPDVQGELALRAARAGKHLLLDKPLALSVTAADRVVAEVTARGLASLVFFTKRFQPEPVAVLDEAVATGGWFSARATIYASIFGASSPYAGSAWRREHGGLWDIGPHSLALILPVLGPVARVAAMTGAHGVSQVLLGHSSGATSTLSLSLDAPTGVNEVLFHGKAGVRTIGPSGSSVDAFGVAIGQLLAQVGTPGHPCDVRFGREVVAVLAAADAAARSGMTVAP